MNDLIKKAVVTEKSSAAQTLDKYTFFIHPNANKIQVKQFFQKEHNVKVLSVNIVQLPKKKRRRGRIVGFSHARKKAVITIDPSTKSKSFEELF